MKFNNKKRNDSEPLRRKRSSRMERYGRQQAFSYYSQRSVQEEARERQSRYSRSAPAPSRDLLRYGKQRFGFFVIILAILACLGSILQLSNDPKIMPASGAQPGIFLQGDQVYHDAAVKLLSTSITNRTKITIRTSDIERELEQQFPELADVHVSLPLLSHRLLIYIRPAQPALILVTADNQAYVLDNRGRVLINTNEMNQKKLSLPVLRDQSSLPVKAGIVALPSTTVTFATAVDKQFAASRVPISSMTLPAGTSELDVYLTDKPYYVRFNLHGNDDMLQQIGTFLAVRSRLVEQGVTPSSYIDVRVAGRAYYQ